MAKILVIEDEAGVRESLVDILNAEDFIVDSATNGEEGLRQIREFHPDLVICDVMMPVLDGYGVLAQVRQDETLATLPFVFLTAKAERDDIRSGMNLGADDYLTKPFTHDDLLRMIRTRLGVHQTLKQETQHQLNALRTTISTALPRELGGPIHEVLSLSATLAEKAEEMSQEQIITLAKAIHRSATQTARLTHNVMLFSRLEQLGKNGEAAISLRQQRTDAADEVITEVAQRIAEEYLREDDLEMMLESFSVGMAKTKLVKVCEELLDNAFIFSPAGTPVRVFGKHQDGTTTLYVIDYGRGMAPEEIEQIGAYRQFVPSTDTVQGAGLGLEIARRLVNLHDGQLLIESIPGQQTIIRLVFPD